MQDEISVGDTVMIDGLVAQVMIARDGDDFCYLDFGKDLGFTHDNENLGGGRKYYWVLRSRLVRYVHFKEVSDSEFDQLVGGTI